MRARDDQILGNDVRLRLPLRACPSSPLATPGGILEDSVLAVPVYADLLDKFPDAELALDAKRQGVDLTSVRPA